MPDIVILQAGFTFAESGDGLIISGVARCSGMDSEDEDITWTVEIDPSDLAATINTAIKDAAVAAAGVRGYTVQTLDKKTLIAGAVGL